jgi:hypothetical protein
MSGLPADRERDEAPRRPGLAAVTEGDRPRTPRARDWREALLGDWHPLVRDPVDVLKLLFVAGTIAFAAMGRSTAIGLAAASAVLVVAHFVNLPRPYDLALVGAMALIAYGTAFDLYQRIPHYDKAVHGLSPFLWAPVVYILLVRLDVLPELSDPHERHHRIGIFLVTFALGLAIGALYEIAEWTMDALLGSRLVHGEQDTVTDLIADGIGSATGGALLVVWSVFGWGTVRRLPGDRLDDGDTPSPRPLAHAASRG